LKRCCSTRWYFFGTSLWFPVIPIDIHWLIRPRPWDEGQTLNTNNYRLQYKHVQAQPSIWVYGIWVWGSRPYKHISYSNLNQVISSKIWKHIWIRRLTAILCG
jgi:hypothetical protein